MASLLLDHSATASTRQADGVHGEDHFQTERALAFLLIIAAAVVLRIWDPWYSTAYMDESIFVVYGRMFLARHLEAPLSTPLQWSFGWYLWPMMAAMADRIGGLAALRELAAALGTITGCRYLRFCRSRIFLAAGRIGCRSHHGGFGSGGADIENCHSRFGLCLLLRAGIVGLCVWLATEP